MLYTRNQKLIFVLLLLLQPIFSWLWVAEATEDLYNPKYLAIVELIQLTPHKPLLIIALLIGILSAILSSTDPKTNEDMSLCLGEHEVERVLYTQNHGEKRSTTRSIQTIRERVVTPTELAHLPELTAYVAFAGDFPITRTSLKIQHHPHIMNAFVETTC